MSGTAAFFTFVGLPFGLLVGLLVGIAYAFTSFVLPRGGVGGAVFGAAALVIFGSRVAPQRSDNSDFDILEPGWMSIAAFCVMALLTGMVTAPIAGRIGAALPTPRAWLALWLVPIGRVVVTAVASIDG